MAGKRDRLSGNEAIAIALRQINPDVFPAFPITPSTEIPQYFASFVANGQVDTEFIPVESEHSSMSAAIGASAAGARSLTATSSCGLAYMWEELYIAASNRLPLALALVNRHCLVRSISTVIILTVWEQEMQAGSRFTQRIIRKLMTTWFRLSAFPSIKMYAFQS